MVDRYLPRRKSASVFLYLLLAFVTGILLDRSGWLPGSDRQPPAGLRDTFAPFWEAWHLVQRYYVDRSSVQPKAMTEGAIEGMLNSLGDVGHTTYLTAEERERLESGLEGRMEGVGARVMLKQREPTIVQTMPNSPARKAGIESGDVIIAVDDKPVEGLPLDRIVEQVRGPTHSEVRLRIRRPKANNKILQFTLTRDRVEIPSVTWHKLPGTSIMHIALQEFGAHADEQMRAALQAAKEQGVRALIIDERGDQGGEKDQAVAVTSEFLKSGVVFIEQDAKGRQTPVAVRPGGVAVDFPICVLIDEGTASSAEIFAAAVQDHQRGKLVGARTFGTGTVLKLFTLSDESGVLLAVAQWLTPKGREIWHKGVQPDVEVQLPDKAVPLLPEDEKQMTAADLKACNDRQLLKAIEVLGEQIR